MTIKIKRENCATVWINTSCPTMPAGRKRRLQSTNKHWPCIPSPTFWQASVRRSLGARHLGLRFCPAATRRWLSSWHSHINQIILVWVGEGASVTVTNILCLQTHLLLAYFASAQLRLRRLSHLNYWLTFTQSVLASIAWCLCQGLLLVRGWLLDEGIDILCERNFYTYISH